MPSSITKYLGTGDGLLEEPDGLLEEALSTRLDRLYSVFAILCFCRVSIDDAAVEHPMTAKSKMTMANTVRI